MRPSSRSALSRGPAVLVATAASVLALVVATRSADGAAVERRSEGPPGLPAAAGPRPDLVATLSAPPAAKPGEEIGQRTRLVVRNIGASAARGTRDNPVGFMVDLTLGRDTTLAVGFKVYSPHYAEDVLLEGARVSRTSDLAPGASSRYPVDAVIPADTPPGSYYLCVLVDPGNVVAESNERNNTTCVPVRILPANEVAEPAATGSRGNGQPLLRSRYVEDIVPPPGGCWWPARGRGFGVAARLQGGRPGSAGPRPARRSSSARGGAAAVRGQG